jgi:hypothetical protein
MLLLSMYNPSVPTKAGLLYLLYSNVHKWCVFLRVRLLYRETDSVRVVVLSGTSEVSILTPSTLWYSLILPGTL